MALTSAHRGYEYQDLLVAARLVDVMLGSVVEIHVDEKLGPVDIFDDLTTVDTAGHRERTQVKHTDKGDQALTLATFIRDARSLQLDRVISAALADRDGPGKQAKGLSYRIILRDTPPTDAWLLAVLRPANPDPGPFVPGMNSVRMSFRADTLLGESKNVATTLLDDSNPFDFLQGGDVAVKLRDLGWVCEHLVVELDAPPASGDLTNPGAAEQLLLKRVRDEVGAGMYPNADPLRHRRCGGSDPFGPCGAAGRHDCHCIGNCYVGRGFVATSARSPVPIRLIGPSRYRAPRPWPNWFNRRLKQPMRGRSSCS